MRTPPKRPRSAFVFAASAALAAVVTAFGCTAGGPSGSGSTPGAVSTPQGGPASGGAPTASSDEACSAKLSAAQSKIRAAVAANRACTKDADCTVVAVSAMCFDSCSGATNKAGSAAVEAARDQVNQSECKAYQDAGCPALPVPPCAPPGPPRCESGMCI